MSQFRSTVSSLSLRALWLLLVLVVLSGCKSDSPPLLLQKKPQDATITLDRMAECLRKNDLVGFSRVLATPTQSAQLEAAWHSGHTQWPFSIWPLGQDIPPLLAFLSSPNATESFQAMFNQQLANQDGLIDDAIRSLALFGTRFLDSQSALYSAQQRSYYKQLIHVLADWGVRAPLADRERAYRAITDLTATTRGSGLASQAALSRLGMEESLRRLGPVWQVLKSLLLTYGLDIDRALIQLKTELVSQNGDNALVRVHYTLAQHEIETLVPMIRLEGKWYPKQVQDAIARNLAASEASHSDETQAPPIFGQ